MGIDSSPFSLGGGGYGASLLCIFYGLKDKNQYGENMDCRESKLHMQCLESFTVMHGEKLF